MAPRWYKEVIRQRLRGGYNELGLALRDNNARPEQRRKKRGQVDLLRWSAGVVSEVLFAYDLGPVARDDGPPASTLWVVRGVKR